MDEIALATSSMMTAGVITTNRNGKMRVIEVTYSAATLTDSGLPATVSPRSTAFVARQLLKHGFYVTPRANTGDIHFAVMVISKTSWKAFRDLIPNQRAIELIRPFA
jgi:hypothetical protein